MESKLNNKQLEAIKKHREKNVKETTHKRRTRILKNNPWWIPRD